MIYRREIDGLRALAVLPVILFHAGFSTFSGGFVGVDVFFVISGYLITSIIVLEREAGRFSLASFYERRARRILPALFVVMAACLPAAWVLLLPADLRDFSGSLAAVSLFASNVLFWRESGYFDSAAEMKPLLHTWSLAVEEQFYLLYPLALLAVWKLAARLLLPCVALAALASLGLAQWGVAHYPSAAFFLLPTRGWELLLGALVALVLARRGGALDVGPRVREAGSLAGFSMLLAAIFLYDPSTPFPGIHALLPTAGTALLILLADGRTLVGKFLQFRLLVATGLISYSAYLWHQPLLAFARHACIDEPGTALLLALCGTSLALAWLTWRFVETPFRDRTRVTRRRVLAMAIAGAVLFIAMGIIGRLDDGHAWRFPAYVAAVQQARHDTNPRRDACHAGSGPAAAPEQACVLGDGTREVGVLLGDSHADAIAHELGRALAEKGIGLRQLTYSACPPVAGLYRREYPGCAAFNQAALDYIVRSPDAQWVVMSARWTLFLAQARFDNREGGVEHREDLHVDILVDGVPATSPDDMTRRANVADRYRAAVLSLLQSGKKVVLVYPIPEAGWDVPTRLARLYLREGAISASDASTSHAVFQARNADTLAVLDSIGEHPNLYRVRPETLLCGAPVPGRCATQHGGTPLYYDDNHLANAGARLLVPQIVLPMP